MAGFMPRISDVCQYIEHVVALQDPSACFLHVRPVSAALCLKDSDAKSEKGRTDAAVAGLEDRVQASLENEGRAFRFSSFQQGALLLGCCLAYLVGFGGRI